MRLRADVPIACFLSGGIDSSAVTAAITRIAASPPQAFSAGFREASFDERRHAAHVARHLEIPYREIETDPVRDADLDRVVRYFDEPFADTSQLPMFRLCKATANHVKVALSGDGADEILAGYPTYAADRLYRLYAHVPPFIQAGLEDAVRRWLKPSYRKLAFDYRLRRFLGSRGLSPERAHAWWRIVFSDAEKRRMLSPEILAEIGDYDPIETFERYFAEVPGIDFLTRALYVDIKTWLADDILVKTDRMSMAHGLEVRSPFLDHRLVEFAMRLEPKAKLGWFRGKKILRDIMRFHLPAATLRRRKAGFGAPAAGVGAMTPPTRDMPRAFRRDFTLDPAAEDVTYKSFAFAALGAWARRDSELRRGL
jgi:asparagine synthase (glutamine-hydrolysing)